jgi:hypothetical protein
VQAFDWYRGQRSATLFEKERATARTSAAGSVNLQEWLIARENLANAPAPLLTNSFSLENIEVRAAGLVGGVHPREPPAGGRALGGTTPQCGGYWPFQTHFSPQIPHLPTSPPPPPGFQTSIVEMRPEDRPRHSYIMFSF